MNRKSAAAAFTAILLVSMFTFVADLSLTEAYANPEFNINRASWPMFHGNPARTGCASGIAPRTNHTIWKFSCGEEIWSSPIIDKGVVYISAAGGNLYALDFSTGQKLWSTHFPGASTTPAIKDDVLYVGYVGAFSALNTTTKTVIWTFSNDNIVTYSSPAVQDGLVYTGSSDLCVYALNATNGHKIWNYSMGMVFSSPAVVSGVVYVSSSDGWVYALSAAKGELVWKYKAAEFVGSSPAVSDGVVYVGSGSPVFYALNASTGRRIWFFSTGDMVESSPCVANGKVFVGSNDANCYALNAVTGEKLWNYSVKGPPQLDCDPAFIGGIVYITPRNGIVYALNSETGLEVWSYDTHWIPTSGFPAFTSPSIANGVVIVGSDNGIVYAFGSLQGPSRNHD